MPLYEYRCASCHHRFSIVCPVSERNGIQICLKCGCECAKRVWSRFKTKRSKDKIADSLSDPSALSDVNENDPVSLGKWAKKTAREMGENLDDEIDQITQEELSSRNSDPNGE